MLRGQLVESAADGLLVVLPPQAGVVVDEGALAEGISSPCGLGRERTASGLGAGCIAALGRGVAREGVGARLCGLEGRWLLLLER